jgi:NADH:ubiquinone oxidoreductase subunit F (NADH-binding)
VSAAVGADRVRAPEGVRRLLGGLGADGNPVALVSHARLYGRLPPVQLDRRAFVQSIAAAGLRGRGGAGFPTADKLAGVLASGGRPVVVANGAEGEPPSGKDAVLLAFVPHLVLDGAVVAARALEAERVIVAVGRSVHSRVVRAIGERRAAGIDRGVSVETIVVPDRFVAGEETALVQFINGGPCLPTFTPPRPFERGVAGAPTLVQNVETLAHVALIARFGAEWFRSIGTESEPGSALVTMSGAVRSPGVYEVPLGLPISELLAGAGGETSEVQALLIGGLFGSWISAADGAKADLSSAGLAPFGAAPGARAIVALPAAACGVGETARIVRYLSAESSGQCGPCVHGLAALADGLEQFADCGYRTDRAALRRRLGSIAGRGACRHPDGAVRLAGSALSVFESEFGHHERARRCTGDGRAVLNLPAQRARAAG